VNGLRLKSFTFSVRGELVEPQKNTFAIGSVEYNLSTMVVDNLLNSSLVPFHQALPAILPKK
jgi:hypothetical protein